MNEYWHLEIKDLEQRLQTDAAKGLAPEEADRRLTQHGPNRLAEKKGHGAWHLFFEQFRNFIIWVLIAAALVSGFLKEWVDALAIIGIVIVNAILGFIQEFRAEKSLAALKKLASPHSRVIRGGQSLTVPSEQLTPGDIVELESGDHVPADCRVVWTTANFSVQEASLTGESTPVAKTSRSLDEPDVPLSERANMVYLGTAVVSGRARTLVAETGMETELGHIAGMIQEIGREPTPLQKRLEQFGKWLIYLCFVLVALVFLLEFLRGGRIIDVFLTAVSLAVAAIPEGLPAVVTIALALGVQRMVRRHALIRKLPSVETLGCATVICSDKTGTLTRNEMTVRNLFVSGAVVDVTGAGYQPEGKFLRNGRELALSETPSLLKLLSCGALCNGARLIENDYGYTVAGDPTEAAILACAAKASLWKEPLEEKYPFVEEIPFDPERKKMTVVRRDNNGFTSYTKGAPDILLRDCSRIETAGAVRPLTEADRQEILRVNTEMADQALRVLGVAYRTFDSLPESYAAEKIEADLTFIGLLAMIDPPREEAREAIGKCRRAGIKTVMITGDHKNTAVAIAISLGFFQSDSLALTGEELDRWSDQQLNREVNNIPVYARVSPEHKLRIVRAWRGQGEVVAMTGDGVNDAPAVKEADIGVAMGITGTDVTKEVADMVVTDDNFASIVAAVEEGRGIYDNIRKFIHFLLSCNSGEILVMFTASLFGLPVPLLPIQILWVNLATDGLPALALGVDPAAPDVMQRPPRRPDEKVLDRQTILLILGQGALIALCSLLAFCFVLFVQKEPLRTARTAAFVVLACSQLFHAFNCRDRARSLFKIGVFTNPQLIAAGLSSLALLMAAVYLGPLQTIFKTSALKGIDLLVAVLLSSLPLWIVEIIKWRKTGAAKGEHDV